MRSLSERMPAASSLVVSSTLFHRAAGGRCVRSGSRVLQLPCSALRDDSHLAVLTRLRAQMQAYADCDDDDVREVVRDGYGKLVEHVEPVSGADPERVRDFFAFGMLLNVFAAMDLLDQPEPWAKRLIAAALENE
jgi:hypothetical protein